MQERFEILIKRQQSGHATFGELTELDEIVNRDPAILYTILEEMEGDDVPPQNPEPEKIIMVQQAVPQSLLEKIKTFINHLFTSLSVPSSMGLV